MKKASITAPIIGAEVVSKALNEIHNEAAMKQIVSNASYGINVVKDQATNTVIDFESLGDVASARVFDKEISFLGQTIKVPITESEYIIDQVVTSANGVMNTQPIKKKIRTINVDKSKTHEVFKFIKDIFELAVLATEDMEIDLRVLTESFKNVDFNQEAIDATGTRRMVKPLIGRAFGNLYTGITNVTDANHRKAAALASGVEVFSQALLVTMLKSKLALWDGMAKITSPDYKAAENKVASVVSNVGFNPNAVRSTVSTIDMTTVNRTNNLFDNTVGGKYDAWYNTPTAPKQK